MTASSLRSLARNVEGIARRAGGIILEVYARAGSMAATAKADGSPLTEADQRSEGALQAGLAALETGYLVVSEESRALPADERTRHRFAWICDPLDGTKEFLAGNGEFCVCIALCDRGEPTLGVIHAPVSARSYVAWRGAAGVYVADAADGAWRVLRKRTPLIREAGGLRVAVSRSHASPPTEAYLARLNQPRRVAMGSALKFCAIADGRIDLYPRLAPTMEWDTAAGQCIVEVAGGAVAAVESDEPLRYNKPDLLNPHFVASAPFDD